MKSKEFDPDYYKKNKICPICGKKVTKQSWWLGDLPVHKKCRQDYILWECMEEYGEKMLQSNFMWRATQIKKALEYDLLHILLENDPADEP